jgi:hypothetical protein
VAVPTVTSLSTALGRSHGGNLLSAFGTNFRVAPALPAPVAEPMRVTVGGKVSPQVGVASSTEVVFLALDDDGEPIPGESATLQAAYRTRKPYYDTPHKSIYGRITDALMDVLENDLVDTVRISSSPDFDPEAADASNVVDLPTYPAIVLLGPRTRLSRTVTGSARSVLVTQTGRVKRRPRGARRDLVYDFLLVEKTKQADLALHADLVQWFDSTGYVYMLRDEGNLSMGTCRYRVGLESDIVSAGEPNLTDVRVFRGTMGVLGVALGDLPGFVDDTVRSIAGVLTDPSVNVEPKEQ